MKKLLFLIVAIIFAASSFAQMSDVTLTVIGTGASEEIATQNALRRALEEAYGAFLVSRTSIVMDELASDEIVVNTNGQIKEMIYLRCLMDKSLYLLQLLSLCKSLLVMPKVKDAKLLSWVMPLSQI